MKRDGRTRGWMAEGGRIQLLTYLESHDIPSACRGEGGGGEKKKKKMGERGGNDRPQRKYTAASRRKRNKGKFV